MSYYRPHVPRSDPGASRLRGETGLARPTPNKLGGNFKNLTVGLLLIGFSNLFTHMVFNPEADVLNLHTAGAASPKPRPFSSPNESLYLMDKASLFVRDAISFEEKVREISDMLGVFPEWLMAVMYSESKFDAAVLNHKGSGATGLIQFMPTTAAELNVSLQRLAQMSHLQQLEYVYLYLDNARRRYGPYQDLADLYLAILYPKARGQDYCYTLYAKPSQAYRQNSGLDENKDGRVTISDIDRRMKRLYPEAYMLQM